jgi:hypothetical protein
MFFPQISPDGSHVAVSWHRALLPGLWLIPIQRSSDARPLSTWSRSFGAVSQSVSASILRGREVTFVAHVKTDVSGSGNRAQCWLRVDRPNRKIGFFDNIQDRPVQSMSWKTVTITGNVDRDAEQLTFGCFLAGIGELWVDEIQLRSKTSSGLWEILPIKNPGFEERDARMQPLGWTSASPGYVFQVTNTSPYKGQRSLSIKSVHVLGSFLPIGWSSDGTYVYAVDQDHPKQIVTLRADGSEMRPLVEVPLREGLSIGEIAITPDGKRVVYSAYQGQSDVWIAENFDAAR